MISLLLLSLLSVLLVVQAHPSDMSCSTSSTWTPGQAFQNMGIASYSLSATDCTLAISPQPAATGFVPNQVFTITVQATQALGMKAVLVGNGATVLSAGAGGSLAAQNTCINYNTRATSRTFTFRAPQTGTVTIRALCGGDREAMYVAPQLVLTAQAGDDGGGVPPPVSPPSSGGGGDDNDDDDDGDQFAGIRLNSTLVAHIVVTLIAFGFLVPWTVSIALFSNTKYVPTKSQQRCCYCSRLSYNTWVSFHFAFAMLGLLLGVAGFATGFVTQTSPEHFTSTHTRLGLAVFVLLCLQVLAGVTRAVWKRFFPQVHAMLGYSLVALAVTTLLFGVIELEDYTNGLPYSFNGIIGEVGFTGPLGIAVVVICAVQLALVAVGLLLRLVVVSQRNNHNSPESNVKSSLKGKAKTLIRMSKVLVSPHLFVYRDLVVDVELFVKQHPGGERAFKTLHGKDITEAFEQQGHSANAMNKLHSLVVGTVQADAQANQLALDGETMQALPATFLMGPTVRRTVRIAQKIALTHNVSEFTLQYAEADLPFGLPVGKHILMFGLDVRNGEEFQRKYTPTEHGMGWFKLVIKIEPTGRMGSMLQLCDVGDTLEIAGPVGLEEYLGNGTFKRYKNGAIRFTDIVFVAGGSGITPCYQISQAIMRNWDDNTMVHLLSCNSTVRDVILQRELEELQRRFPQKFKVWFTVSQPPPSSSSQHAWYYSVGRISHSSSADILDKYRSLPKATTLVISCGPKGFTECTKLVFEQQLGFFHVMEY